MVDEEENKMKIHIHLMINLQDIGDTKEDYFCKDILLLKF